MINSLLTDITVCVTNLKGKLAHNCMVSYLFISCVCVYLYVYTHMYMQIYIHIHICTVVVH